MPNSQFLLVEPIAKTPFPPLGLMKISSMLKKRFKRCAVFSQVGTGIPPGLHEPSKIYITSLFTWDFDKVVKTIHFYQDRYPKARVQVGGIAASLLSNKIKTSTGIQPHIGLYRTAENHPPDYNMTFGRKLEASITFTTRGCPRHCKFCSVKDHEPEFHVRNRWEKDVSQELSKIIFWDNNFLASSNFEKDCKKIRGFGKTVDFNQGLDARLYTKSRARILGTLDINPIRFAFDNVKSEKLIIRAIELAKKHTNREIRLYVLYNFNDTPEDFYYRIDLLNRMGVLSFPMEYRHPTHSKTTFPGPAWNYALLRALKLSLLFYYRKGMITDTRKSFLSIYGKNQKQFVDKLYKIYEYDKSLKRKRKRK